VEYPGDYSLRFWYIKNRSKST